jgi:sirohydrochlorin ferrochelatase
LAPASLEDAALIEAIPDAGIANAPELAAEAGRRQLAAAVPALERLCRRFVGFGSDRTIPEQLAAVEALAMIGGSPAREAIVRIIVSRVVQGPGLVSAIAAAVHLGADLPTDIALDLLRHPDPHVRASACGCIGTSPAVIPILLELMGDLDPDVRHAAASALGRLGRPETRAALIQRLRERPSPAVIEAITAVADKECVILLGRIARILPDLANAARKALEAIEHPRAAQILLHLQTSGNR